MQRYTSMSRRRKDPTTAIIGLFINLLMLPFVLFAKLSAGSRKRKWKSTAPRRTDGASALNRSGGPPQRQQEAQLDITWVEHFNPPEAYRIEYADRYGEFSERVVHLARKGHYHGNDYLGIYEDGKFKTLRADRILKVEWSGDSAPRSSLRVLPSESTTLPVWSLPNAVYKIKQTTGARNWTVNLNTYTCTCPEKRMRIQLGAADGTLGRVCSHMAQAIMENLPADANWNADILAHISNPRKVSMANFL
jgi:hypothetical protein